LASPGLVLIDKPTDWTSHDVVAKVRKAVGTKKVGHAGTLDPLATGLLVLGIESGTKLLTFLVGADKTYEATIRRVECSSGTYIRALARDLGNLLGVGGHITALRRTKVGHFDVTEANSIEELSELRLTELAAAAKQLFPVIELTESEVTDLIHGKRISAKSEVTGLAAGLSMSGKLVAVLESVKTDLKSVVVFQGEKND
jgi:tRNA U55 pseudouridine synthase TruB